MKKTLLLSAALMAAGMTTQAQYKLTNGYDLKFDATKHTVYKYAAGDAQAGYYFGTNSLDDRYFAQRFDFNGWNDSVTVLGVIGIWEGYTTPASIKSIDMKLWTATRKAYPATVPVAGSWKYIAPGTELASASVIYLPTLKLTGTDTSFRYFSAPKGVPMAHATRDTRDNSLFVGFDMLSCLPYATHSDSIGLASTISSSYQLYVLDTFKRDTVSTSPLTINYSVDSLVNSPSLIYNSVSKIWQNSYLYKGKMVDFLIAPIFGTIFTGIESVTNGNLSFYGNYPNPASNKTNFKFGIKEVADITIRIVDGMGRTVNVVQLPKQSPGTHVYEMDLSSFATGNYIYTVSTASASMGATFTVIK